MKGIAALVPESVEFESEPSRIREERYVNLCAFISYVTSESIFVDA
jgi:hypothetical protein